MSGQGFEQAKAMTRVWTKSGFVADDPWAQNVAGDGGSGTNGRPILALAAFLEAAAAQDLPEGPIGVLVAPADDVATLAPYLDRVALVAVAFPASNDGRAFSHAALLRTRHGYRGEIRATGDVLLDQIPLMIRCGIDSFAVSHGPALKRLAEGRLNGIDNRYQPAPSGDATKPQRYSWRRIAEGAA